ncbi:hypothetical protein AAY473_018824, partial [Plecturocebus cupreus]
MGPAEPVHPVYSAPGSATWGHQQNSCASQKSHAGDQCGSSAGNLPACEQQKFVGNRKGHTLHNSKGHTLRTLPREWSPVELCKTAVLLGPTIQFLEMEYETSLANMAKPRLYQKYKNQPVLICKEEAPTQAKYTENPGTLIILTHSLL